MPGLLERLSYLLLRGPPTSSPFNIPWLSRPLLQYQANQSGADHYRGSPSFRFGPTARFHHSSPLDDKALLPRSILFALATPSYIWLLKILHVFMCWQVRPSSCSVLKVSSRFLPPIDFTDPPLWPIDITDPPCLIFLHLPSHIFPSWNFPCCNWSAYFPVSHQQPGKPFLQTVNILGCVTLRSLKGCNYLLTTHVCIPTKFDLRALKFIFVVIFICCKIILLFWCFPTISKCKYSIMGCTRISLWLSCLHSAPQALDTVNTQWLLAQ